MKPKKLKKFTKKEILELCIRNDLFEVQAFTGGIKEGELSVFFCDVEVLHELQRFTNALIVELVDTNDGDKTNDTKQ